MASSWEVVGRIKDFIMGWLGAAYEDVDGFGDAAFMTFVLALCLVSGLLVIGTVVALASVALDSVFKGILLVAGLAVLFLSFTAWAYRKWGLP